MYVCVYIFPLYSKELIAMSKSVGVKGCEKPFSSSLNVVQIAHPGIFVR